MNFYKENNMYTSRLERHREEAELRDYRRRDDRLHSQGGFSDSSVNSIINDHSHLYGQYDRTYDTYDRNCENHERLYSHYDPNCDNYDHIHSRNNRRCDLNKRDYDLIEGTYDPHDRTCEYPDRSYESHDRTYHNLDRTYNQEEYIESRESPYRTITDYRNALNNSEHYSCTESELIYPESSEELQKRPSKSLRTELESYKDKPIIYWTGEDCLSWGVDALRSYNVSIEDDDCFNTLRDLTGRDLINYNKEEFLIRLNGITGIQLYESFQQYLLKETDQLLPPKKNPRFRPKPNDGGVNELSSLCNHVSLEDNYLPYTVTVVGTKTKLPGYGESDETRLVKKISVGTSGRGRNPKSWEFLLRLIRSPKYNPSVIRWEDEASGTFKLVKKDDIASLWATRSAQHKAVSYESFARILRYHYTTKALCPVSEKHLVYRFSEEVMRKYWQNEDV